MIIEQIYTGCLAQGAYYIQSKGEVAIIDPLREITPYLEKAAKNKAVIKYVFETHFHADFVSGHVTLSEKTGAPIIFGPNANPSFKAIIAADNQEFKLGELTIKVLHTPGHTMESTTYLLIDKNEKEIAIFSGDTLFLGDVGRPDLAQKTSEVTQEDLAGILYDSIQNKILPLPDEVLVYPAHGAGSACGKNMMKETVDTLGNQKKVNYALRAGITKKEFIKEVTEGLLPPPKYFPLNVRMNKEGYEDVIAVLERGARALSVNDFESLANETGALVLDVRHQGKFVEGHIPRSISIGLDGGFAPWAGALIADAQHPILLVAPEGREEEAITRLSRVGFDSVIGYLEGSFLAWENAKKEYDTINSITAEEMEKNEHPFFDVRKETEYKLEHVLNAKNTPLDVLNNYTSKFLLKEPFYIYCAGGYRSVIAASILKSRGIHNMINVEGGFPAIKKTGIAVSDYTCAIK